MDKSACIAAHRAALNVLLDGLRNGSEAARAGTRVDGTHRPASRGERAAVTSQGYLAHGLGQRIAELEEALRVLALVEPGPRSKVANGAFVILEDEHGRRRELFVLPGGDGTSQLGVTVVSVRSPWIAPFVGCEEGEVGDVLVAGERLEVEVVHVE